MMIVMPEWYTKAEERMKDLVWKISQEQNIDWHFISDSKSINGSIGSIENNFLSEIEECKEDD